MNGEVFTEVVKGMMQTLYRVSCTQLRSAADREDAVQEALRRAWEKRHTLRDERYAQTWLIRILLNECERIRRKNARMQPVGEVNADCREEQNDALKQAILSLEDDLRIPVLLHYVEGCCVGEVARMLSIPAGTVKSRLYRGRKKLRTLLDEEVFEE